MTYFNTLILPAEDCPTDRSEVPPLRGRQTPKHVMELNLLQERPYALDQEELTFAVWTARKDLTEQEVQNQRQELWNELFAKGQPCLRASSLTKRYGWAAHYDQEGKIGLVDVSSEKYKNLIDDEGVTKIRAMRSRRK